MLMAKKHEYGHRTWRGHGITRTPVMLETLNKIIYDGYIIYMVNSWNNRKFYLIKFEDHMVL